MLKADRPKDRLPTCLAVLEQLNPCLILVNAGAHEVLLDTLMEYGKLVCYMIPVGFIPVLTI